jgi:signal transduction histidine kinase/ActR/RegA family two-component response regulator
MSGGGSQGELERHSALDRWLAQLLPGMHAVADGEERQRARLLAIGALLAGGLTLTLIPQVAGEVDPPVHLWVVIALGIAGASLVLGLVRAGRIAAAGYTFPAVAIAIGALMEVCEGATSARANVLIVGVIMAGLLVRPAAALGFTAAAVAAIVLAHVSSARGWVTPVPQEGATWLTSVRLVLLSGLLVTLMAAVLRGSIDRLRHRERELSLSLAELERVRRTEEAARARLQQAERLEALGRLAGGVAHDFNNLLTVILGNASLALAGDRDRHLLEQIAAAGDRGAQLTRQLLAFSRQQPMPVQRVDVHTAILELLPLLGRLLGESVSVETSLRAADAAVLADPGRFDQVLVNLAVNAQQAMPAGGTLRFETADAPDPARFRVTVRDDGLGMTPEVRAQIFEPFFSTRSAGTGLGLATVAAVVEELGGSIAVETAPGAGAAFVVELPRAPAVASAPPAEPAAGPAAAESTVLLVDDDRTVRQTVRKMLEALGYGVLCAASADEARAALCAHGHPVALCLTDVVLASGSGPDVAAAVLAQQPSCPLLYMSGYTAGELARRGIDAEAGFLPKPFTAAQLARAVADRIGARGRGAARS